MTSSSSSARWAHPCSRRENTTKPGTRSKGSGTPLLAQGEPSRPGQRRKPSRHTPARAGRTGTARRAGSRCRAHPCSRRENILLGGRGYHEGGTPLLAQGEPSGLPREQSPGRHTPARAGRTVGMHRVAGRQPAHPCSRRENEDIYALNRSAKGTPLLAQGERLEVCDVILTQRHTPARAGRTPSRSSPRPGRWAHPCSRRENGEPDPPRRPGAGTPLLAQGEHQRGGGHHDRVGHTPARAGRTP